MKTVAYLWTKGFLLLSIMPFIFYCCKKQEKKEKKKTQKTVNYPETRRDTVVDVYFGTEVADPYRWLEDENSEETKAWIKAENKLTSAYLKKIPYRDSLRKRMEHLWDYEKFTAPFTEGDYTYFYKNDGTQEQFVLYRQKGDDSPEVFLDPNTFSEDGTVFLSQISFSKNGKLAAYAISENGSDWRKIIVMDAVSKKSLGDTLDNVKFSDISWRKSYGFYYSGYDKPQGNALSGKTDRHKLYYHRPGTSQEKDVLVFGGKKTQKYRYVNANVTEDGRYLIISAAVSTSGNKLYIKNLNDCAPKLRVMVDDFDSDSYVIDNIGSKLYIVTNRKAPNRKVVTVNALKPGPKNWKDLIPETQNVLSPTTGAGYLFANYMVDAISKVFQYDMKGKPIREIKLPGIGSVSGFGAKRKAKALYFTFSNYTTPATIYKMAPLSGEYKIYKRPAIDFNSGDYSSEQVFYTSKDGTRVPMIITHKKGVVLDGKNPTILYGYGGFNISITPRFKIATAVWLEQGGIYAVPNLRGGGEYGKAWHDAGIQMNKQNVFDDFIAAAEYLINNKYTSSEFLAVQGRSNGGLLVGATMTQRPDLMKVALPGVGVLDMLRYHTFTAGAGWAYDYGTSQQSKEMFDYLKGYSPLHNVKKNVHYPATLITTGDHDDRVVPAHSFKFAAELQAKQTGPNPVFIRIETNAGHGAATPASKIIAEYTDVLSFTLYNMNYTEPIKEKAEF